MLDEDELGQPAIATGDRKDYNDHRKGDVDAHLTTQALLLTLAVVIHLVEHLPYRLPFFERYLEQQSYQLKDQVQLDQITCVGAQLVKHREDADHVQLEVVDTLGILALLFEDHAADYKCVQQNVH